MECTAEAAKCVVHLGRSYPREDPSCSGPVPTANTSLNPAHIRPERRALHKEPRLDDTIRPRRDAGHCLEMVLLRGLPFPPAVQHAMLARPEVERMENL